MSKCWFCGAELIWQQDFTYEDYGFIEKKNNTVALLRCSNEECGTMVECYEGYFCEEDEE